MSLAAPYQEHYYIADGITTSFSFGEYFTALASANVKCIIYFEDGTNCVPTFNVDMTTGFITIVTLTKPDGTVLTVPPAGSIVRVFRDTPEQQNVTASQLQNYTAKQLERIFDSVVAMIQEVSYSDLHKSIKLTETQRDVSVEQLTEEKDQSILYWDFESRTLKATDYGQDEVVKSDTVDRLVYLQPEGKIYFIPKGSTTPISIGSVSIHNDLGGRNAPDCHPESAITNLTTHLQELRDRDTAIEYKADQALSKAGEALDTANHADDNATYAVGLVNTFDGRLIQAESDASEAKEKAIDAKTTVDNHVLDYNNPHQVTKAQVGLGNVDNTADLDKPIIIKSNTIPVASAEVAGKIYQYSGETNATYGHGYIYECKETPVDSLTFAWVRIDVQPNTAVWGSITGTITNQTDLVNYVSGVESGLQSQINTINGKIPSQASSTNQLADKDFVNSSISTATATFRGTYNSVAELEAYSGAKDLNDYAFVISTDTAGNTLYNRYKYDGSNWVFEYALNNSSFTANQWAAINSGATSTNIAQIGTNTNDIATNKGTMDSHIANTNNPHSVTKAQVGLGNVDNTSDLNKPISTATQTALDGKQATISDLATIRSNAQAGKAASDTIATYGDIVTHDISEFATAAQGAKADTALQAGDNVSELANDAGYLVMSDLTNFVTRNTAQTISGLKTFSADIVLSGTTSIKNTTNGVSYTMLYHDTSGIHVGTSTQALLLAGSNARPKFNNNDIAMLSDVPTAVSQLTNDTGFITNAVNNLQNYTLTSNLATVATSGSYNDLSDTPTIPIVNNPTITITQGGVTKGSFTLNQATGDTIALDAGGGGGSVDIDNSTITKNGSDQLQAVATINANSAAGATNPVYDWVGTLAEYTSQSVATNHPEWLCYITDDLTAQSYEAYTKTQSDSTFVAKGHEVIAFQAPTAQNNYTWYRKYADGWVEQGGAVENNSSASTTINLPVTMSDTHYTVVLGGKYDNNSTIAMFNSKTINSFVVTCQNYNHTDATRDFDWQVSGMAA